MLQAIEGLTSDVNTLTIAQGYGVNKTCHLFLRFLFARHCISAASVCFQTDSYETMLGIANGIVIMSEHRF